MDHTALSEFVMPPAAETHALDVAKVLDKYCVKPKCALAGCKQGEMLRDQEFDASDLPMRW